MVEGLNDGPSCSTAEAPSSSASKTKQKRVSQATRERRERNLKEAPALVRFAQAIQNKSSNELSTLLPTPAPPLLAPLLTVSGQQSVQQHQHHQHYRQHYQQQQMQQQLQPISPGGEMRLPDSVQEARRFRSRYKRLHRSNKTRRRPRHPAPQQHDPDFITLTRFLYHITSNNESGQDESVHYFRDDYGRWLACKVDEKDNGGGIGALNVSQVQPSNVPNDKLLNSLLRQQLNQNFHEGNWVWPDHRPRNSCSSLSLNSAGEGLDLYKILFPNQNFPLKMYFFIKILKCTMYTLGMLVFKKCVVSFRNQEF